MITYLIMKVIGKCNLGCDYCYYMNDLAGPFRTRMESATVIRIYDSLSQHCRSNGIGSVAFTWHGGEPTLVGKDFYREVLDAQKRYFAPNIRVRNSIQTNATLLDDEWADLFKAYDFSVGVSVDGSPESHDAHRYYRRGFGSYNKVVDGIHTLVRNGVRFGTITVVDPALDGRQVFEHLYALGIRKMDFNLPILTLDAFEEEYGPDAMDRFAAYMCNAFDAWLERDDPDVDIRSLTSLVKLMLGGRPTYCHSSNSCDRYITVEPNGDVGACENLRVVANGGARQAGPVSLTLTSKPASFTGGFSPHYHTATNVRTNTFAEIEQAVGRKFDEHGYNRRGEICEECTLRTVCNSGCPVHRFRDDGTGFQNPSFFCNYYKTIIEHIARRVSLELAS